MAHFLALCIGFAAPFDPSDLQVDSGVLGATFVAMREVVAQAVPLSGALPVRVGRLAHVSSVAPRMRPRDLRDPRAAAKHVHSAAQLGRPTIAARNRLIRRRIAAAGHLDGIVQRGCEMLLPPGHRFVTYEDSTVVQARESYSWPHLKALSDRDFERYIDRQRRIYSAAVACCCTTHWVADSIVGDYGIPRERVFVVGNGQHHTISEEIERDWSRPRYLFIGVDWQRKNGAAVVDAFTRVRAHHPDAQLDVVGGHPPLDVPGVVGHGYVSRADPSRRDHIAALFREATVFVMPSLHEPAGIVFAEAGSAGVPSIGSSCGGCATMIGPGGLVVDPLDADHIYRAMLQLADPGVAQRMGELARRQSQQLTWRKVAERLVRALAIPGTDTTRLAEFL